MGEPNKVASSIVDQGTRIARQEEEKSREARSKTRDPMRTSAATCCAAATPARQALQLLAMKRNTSLLFTEVKEKPWVPPKKQPAPRVGGRLLETNVDT